ncbi:SDR family NAD(P)-dependent oxidoreductase [Spiribacter roseus]|uniref:SDR family NAD(P)-dependent oxidoreductase n=1 Tax=Spiribacter roseus TaxID=1855875 RepID=UPI001F46A875|nr:SDR family NAD(P)-dependent oxidoreductase [Spiribacter roseus]
MNPKGDDMPEGVVVITGAGTGIGRALAIHYADRAQSVLAIGRREAPLQALADEYPLVRAVPADVASDAGRAAIIEALGDQPIRALVHNAGVLEPVGPLLEQSAEALRSHLAVNLEAPIALSRALRGRMANNGRILHVSSGAAHRAMPGWGAYCISKAALHMAYQVLKAEMGNAAVHVGSLRPGVVDTPMQSLIRSQSVEDFPAVENFRALKANDALTAPARVATFMAAVLALPGERFSEQEWDIREHWDQVVDG